jgi:uncharacterized protein (DUF2249 family)
LTGVKAATDTRAQVGDMKNAMIVTVDVRRDIRLGHEPFGRIMSTVAQLSPGQKLLLLAPFEPLPLYRILEGRGFTHSAEEAPSGHWEVLFERQEPAIAEGEADAAGGEPGPLVIDARGLKPPMPMMRILEALATLPPETQVEARTDRYPILLLEELPAAGFIAETIAATDGTYVTRIRRA